MVKPYQRIVSLVCIACETCECERCNVEDLAKRIIDDVRADAIEELSDLIDRLLWDYDKKTYKDLSECFKESARLLKEQKNLSCFDCKHHFMSDCYLECNKHNRINDKKICDDFEQLKEQNNGQRM